MSLIRQRDILAVVQIALATTTVVWAGGTTLWAALLAALFVAHAFVRPLPAITTVSVQRRWTVGVGLAVCATAYRAFAWAQILDAGVDLLLLLAVQRFYCRQQTREHLQLMLIGALLMTVGAVINADLNYPIILVAYLGVAAMALLLNQLIAAGERHGATVHMAIDRHARRHGGVLWRSALGVAGVAAAGGVAVFLFFPRFGIGTFVRGMQPTQMTSGFSNEVELGHFGTIRNDERVIMRVVPDRIEPEPLPHLPLYFRGSSFDRYRDGRWDHTPSAFTTGLVRLLDSWAVTDEAGVPLLATDRSRRVVSGLLPRPIAGFAHSTSSWGSTITLEDLGTELMFAPSQPLAVTPLAEGFGVVHRLRPGQEGQILAPNRPAGPYRYRTLSRVQPPSPAELRAVGHPVTDNLVRYLEVPAELSPAFRQLATQLTAKASTQADKVDAVLAHLADFTYTVDLLPFERPVTDPIEGFLFETRAGHCEYFATAAALLLREAGVPTRLVNGYLGADWNPVGGYYGVRQAQAHSWIEVRFGHLGWITVDPTPASGRPGPGALGTIGPIEQWVDALRNAYLKRVIDFGFDDQMDMLSQLGFDPSRRRGPPLRAVVPWFAAILAAGLGWWTWRRLRRQPPVSAEVRIYRRLLARLARAGFPRQDHESPTAFALRLRAHKVEFADSLLVFARGYEAVRFGSGPGSPDRSTLRRLARQVRPTAR